MSLITTLPDVSISLRVLARLLSYPDAALRADLADMRDAGTTIFVVTHQAALMESVADECMVLEAGRMVAREKGIPSRMLSPYAMEARR